MPSKRDPKKPASPKKRAKRKTGRPSSYRVAYAKQAKKLCLLGAIDKELADFFGVSEVTINAWKVAHPPFLKSLKEGKEAADARVAHSLFRRALGYSHPAVKIIAVARGGNEGSAVEEIPYTERYAPDTTAAIFWLKNRRPDQWRDKQAIEHSGQIAGTGVLAVPIAVDAAQWEAAAAAQQRSLATVTRTGT